MICPDFVLPSEASLSISVLHSTGSISPVPEHHAAALRTAVVWDCTQCMSESTQ